jgi:hypothetical protein
MNCSREHIRLQGLIFLHFIKRAGRTADSWGGFSVAKHGFLPQTFPRARFLFLWGPKLESQQATNNGIGEGAVYGVGGGVDLVKLHHPLKISGGSRCVHYVTQANRGIDDARVTQRATAMVTITAILTPPPTLKLATSLTNRYR